MLHQVRRIVTANDAEVKSGVLIDAIADNIITGLTELWITGRGPVNHTDGIDHGARSTQLEPPHGGTLFRYLQIAPESAQAHLSLEERQQAARDWFAGMRGGHLQPDTSRHPAMHKSSTADYIIRLKGQITLVLDKEERDLKPFDVVVQRGTNHAWVNRGSEDALLMAVPVDDGSASG